MKCLITNKPTNTVTNGRFPLSTEGRQLLKKIVARHNERIRELFIETHEKRGLDPKYLEKLSPKVSNKYALSLIEKGEPDMMETVAEITGKDDEKE